VDRRGASEEALFVSRARWVARPARSINPFIGDPASWRRLTPLLPPLLPLPDPVSRQ